MTKLQPSRPSIAWRWAAQHWLALSLLASFTAALAVLLVVVPLVLSPEPEEEEDETAEALESLEPVLEAMSAVQEALPVYVYGGSAWPPADAAERDTLRAHALALQAAPDTWRASHFFEEYPRDALTAEISYCLGLLAPAAEALAQANAGSVARDPLLHALEHIARADGCLAAVTRD